MSAARHTGGLRHLLRRGTGTAGQGGRGRAASRRTGGKQALGAALVATAQSPDPFPRPSINEAAALLQALLPARLPLRPQLPGEGPVRSRHKNKEGTRGLEVSLPHTHTYIYTPLDPACRPRGSTAAIPPPELFSWGQGRGRIGPGRTGHHPRFAGVREEASEGIRSLLSPCAALRQSSHSLFAPSHCGSGQKADRPRAAPRRRLFLLQTRPSQF